MTLYQDLPSKLQDKKIVVACTKIATSQASQLLHLIFPMQKLCNFNQIMWAETHEKHGETVTTGKQKTMSNTLFEEIDQLQLGYAAQMVLGKTDFLDEADIYIESSDEEMFWPEAILQSLPKHTMVLRRPVREWMLSTLNFYGRERLDKNIANDRGSYHANFFPFQLRMLPKLIERNRFYARLEKYKFKTLDVSQSDWEWLFIEHYQKHFFNEIAKIDRKEYLNCIKRRPNSSNDWRKSNPITFKRDRYLVDQIIKQLQLTDEEMRAPYIERLL